jgi:hypothetical protein
VSWKVEQENGADALRLTLPAEAARSLADIECKRGRYEFASAPGVVVTVVPSEITDPQGDVIEVLG